MAKENLAEKPENYDITAEVKASTVMSETEVQETIIMNVFITLNPHIENLSRNKLIKDFRFILQKYYRKVLGPRYYKHKDKQYKIGIFQEDGFSDFIQPHLHIIIDISLKYINEFYVFIKENLSRLYPSLTTDLQVIKNTKNDLEKVYQTCRSYFRESQKNFL